MEPVQGGQIEELTFEEALSQLEKRVKLLEEGGLSLDAAVKVFEEGHELQIYCAKKLAEVKLRIEKVIQQNQAGEKEIILESADL